MWNTAPAKPQVALCGVIALLTLSGACAITQLRHTALTPPLDRPPATPVGVSRVQTPSTLPVPTSCSMPYVIPRDRGSFYSSASDTSPTGASSSSTTAGWCLRGPTAERLAASPKRVMVDTWCRLVHIGGLGGWTWVIAPLGGGLVGFLLFLCVVYYKTVTKRGK